VTEAGRPTSQFIESQTIRSVQSLFVGGGRVLRDLGLKEEARVIEAEDKDGRKTSYSVDLGTSLIHRIEFVTGELKDIVGRPVPSTDAYVFSDFRQVQGVTTSFRIERYINGIKTEETQFTSVSFNASLTDAPFRP
jgi:hypothetical protein